jgi:hypothetical protein
LHSLLQQAQNYHRTTFDNMNGSRRIGGENVLPSRYAERR